MLLRCRPLQGDRRRALQRPVPLPRVPVHLGRPSRTSSWACPTSGFAYTKGAAKRFQRNDLAAPVTREFCAECGTHLLTKTSGLPGAVLLKVGTFDDPSLFPGPQMVIFTIDKQSFHHVPEGVPTFERTPG